MSKELNDYIIDGEEAKILLNNQFLTKLFTNVETQLDESLLICDTSKDSSVILDIARHKQLISNIKEQIHTAIEHGNYAKIELEGIESKRLAGKVKKVLKR